MNVLIVGARGAGKTTLIRRVLESRGLSGSGDLETEKEGDQVHIMMRGRSMCPQRRIWWACAERPVGFR